MKEAPATGLTDEEAEGRAACVLALLAAIEVCNARARELEAEIGDARERFPDPESLAA